MKKTLLLFAAAVGFTACAGDYDEFIGTGPGKVPGAVSIGCADGKITVKCYGFADAAAKMPMTADTVGWLASNTKAIACALVLSYVEEGKLQLDSKVSRYLPEWKGEKVPTLRQCMSHTSGLKFFPELPIDRRPVRELSRLGAQSERVASPGEKFLYSNWGIDIAVACVEAVAGRPWNELLKERILDPLDMRDAVFFPTEDQGGRMAKGYELTDDKPAKKVTVNQFQYPYTLRSRYPEAGGGLFGSPMDMIKFFAMVANDGVGLNGRRVLKAETVAFWFEKQTPECVGEKYSFGAWVSEDGQMMSHGGAWSTWGCAYRGSGVARVFFVQYAGGESKGYEKFRSLVDKDAEASYSPVRAAEAAPVLPGYLADPSAMKERVSAEEGYQTPDALKYPYISTYYVKPTVMPEESVKVGIFVTDFDSSKIRFLDDSHRFTAFLEYRLKGESSKTMALKNLKSGDAEFDLGRLPAGEYEMRVWAVDAKGRESHRVIHDFRVVSAADIAITAEKVYRMTESDLAAYGIRNDGDLERIVYVGTNGVANVVKEKRAGVPGYTVTVPLDPKTGKLPIGACKKATVVYDEGYDKSAVEADSVKTAEGIQKLLDEKAAAGFRKFVMLPGTYRISWTKSVEVPSNMTLDLGNAVLKQNGFTGASSVIVRFASATDAHLVGGTLEGDYWEHDYAGSPNNSEWPTGFFIGGDSRYCSVDGVKIVDITGYGGQNGIAKDSKGWLSFFFERLPAFAPGGLDAKTGAVDAADGHRFTTDFKDIMQIVEKGRSRLQISKHLGYQGRVTRSWQMTVAWYDAQKRFLSAETAWQYREMWIPEGAAFLRVSVEDASAEAADKSGLVVTAFRLPVNCVVRNCTFDHCRCVGHAASAMKNMLFEGNFFTASGESAACCAFDAEDGWDQMQDVYFLKNVFRENPRNNSILTCGGHNFILEGNEGDIYFWGRTHSPCVRNSVVNEATYRCDSRLNSGYGRFDGNTYQKGLHLGVNDKRTDGWDYVLSGLDLDGAEHPFVLDVGAAGRVVNCRFRNMAAGVANAYACSFENCTDASGYLSFPGGRWYEVTVKECVFNRFKMTNDWERCRFVNSKLSGFNGCRFSVKDGEFRGCTLFGFRGATLQFADSAFEDTDLQGDWFETPSDIVFRNCKIRTRNDSAFLRLGGYTVGRIGFDGCTVAGERSLVDIKDLRRFPLPKNAAPETNPDLKPGAVAFRRTKWSGGAETVLSHVKDADPSPKKISILDKDNAWPKGVLVAADIPSGWELK